MSFRGSGVLGLMNFICHGLDPFVCFCGNNFRFNIRKYLNQMSDSKSTLVFLCFKENLCIWALLVFETSSGMKTVTSLFSCNVVRRACSLHEFIWSFRCLLRCSLASDFVLLDPCLSNLSC
jgi:hypothetical protein